MSDLLALTAAEAGRALRGKKCSAREMTEAYLAAIEETAGLNMFVNETADHARAMADVSDARLAAGEARPLEGIPVGVKDMFCTEGVASTACSNILKGFVPPYESTVTANLWADGAVMLGKLNCDEFAMGSANETSAFGPAVNPWQAHDDPARRTAGGSSGGSAAAVAAHSALLATGTDTGGSIRQPAAFCGIVGIKPTYGRCSRRGIVSFASSLDQAGPLARNVEDAALMLQSMASHDSGDSTSVAEPMPVLADALSAGIKGKTVGIPAEYTMDGMDPVITELWQQGRRWLEQAGATCREVSLPHTRYALPTYYIIAPAEASSNLARYDGVRYGARTDGPSLDDMYAETRANGFGAEVTRRIMIGTYVLSAGYYDAYYLKAQRVRRLIQQDFINIFDKVDLLLTPATPSSAFPLGQEVTDPVVNFLNDVFTVPASLAGVPAMSVPAGFDSSGLPLGLQLIAPSFREDALVAAGKVLEEASGFDATASLAATGNAAGGT